MSTIIILSFIFLVGFGFTSLLLQPSAECDIENQPHKLNQTDTVSRTLDSFMNKQNSHYTEFDRIQDKINSIEKDEDRTWSLLLGGWILTILAFVGLAGFLIIEARKIRTANKLALKAITQAETRALDKMNDQITQHITHFNQQVDQAKKTILDTSSLTSSLSTGKYLYLAGNIDDAIKLFSTVLEKQPDNLEAMLYRGFCYLHSSKIHSNFEKGIKDLKTALENPQYSNNLEAHMALARGYERADQLTAAISEARYSAALNPNSTTSLLFIARAYIRLGDLNKAMDAYQEILSIIPRSSDAIVGLGDILFDKQDYNGVIDWFTKAINTQRPYATYYIRRAYGYWSRNLKNDRELAQKDLEHAKSFGITNNQIYIAEGTFYAETGNWDKAIESFIRGLSYSPRTVKPFLRNLLASCYLAIGSLEKAIMMVELSRTERPDHPANYTASAESLLIAKRYPEAEAVSSQGLMYAKDSQEYYWLLFSKIVARSFQGVQLENLQDDLCAITKAFNVFPQVGLRDWHKWNLKHLAIHITLNITALSPKMQTFISDFMETVQNSTSDPITVVRKYIS